MALGGILLLDWIRLDSAESELDLVVADPGFSNQPENARLIETTRANYCGNPWFDQYPPNALRSFAVDRSGRAAARRAVTDALAAAGWRRERATNEFAGEWVKEFEDVTAAVAVSIDDFVPMQQQRSDAVQLRVFAFIVTPDFCKP